MQESSRFARALPFRSENKRLLTLPTLGRKGDHLSQPPAAKIFPGGKKKKQMILHTSQKKERERSASSNPGQKKEE